LKAEFTDAKGKYAETFLRQHTSTAIFRTALFIRY